VRRIKEEYFACELHPPYSQERVRSLREGVLPYGWRRKEKIYKK